MCKTCGNCKFCVENDICNGDCICLAKDIEVSKNDDTRFYGEDDSACEAYVDKDEAIDAWEALKNIDIMQYPHDMVYIAAEFLNGNEHDMEMVTTAFDELAPGLYSEDKTRDELLEGLRVALNA